MNLTESRALFVRHSRWLARVLEALVVLTLLSVAVPFALGQPTWHLWLSEAAMNLAPVLLLAVILRLLSGVLIAGDLWVESDRQVSREIARSDTRAAALRSSLMASTSESELRRLLASNVTGPSASP